MATTRGEARAVNSQSFPGLGNQLHIQSLESSHNMAHCKLYMYV